MPFFGVFRPFSSRGNSGLLGTWSIYSSFYGRVLVLVLADLTCGFGDSVGYINSPINLMASIVIAMNMSIFPPSVV